MILEEGLNSKMYRIITNLYEVVESCVMINDEYSEFFKIEAGVRQGCILSPVLFNLFINGIAKKIKAANIGVKYNDTEEIITQLLFADDIVLLANNANELQQLIDIVHDESKKWQFKVNLDKTNIVVFNQKKNENEQHTFKLDDKELQVVNEYKYLGVNVENGLRWNEMKKRMLSKAKLSMIKSLAMTHYAELLTVESGVNIWQALIRPNLEYGAEVWGDVSWNEAERVQLEVGRKILNVKDKTSDVFVRGELGWWTMQARRHELQIRFLHRLLHMPDDRITKKIFLQSKRMMKQKIVNTRKTYSAHDLWYEKVRMVMNKYGIREEELYLSNWKSIIKTRIHEYEQKQWKTDMWNVKKYESKLDIYKQIKTELQYESYLSDGINRRGTIALTRFRSGSHWLRVETDRHVEPKPDRRERICTSCKREVDDEQHLLFTCEYHDHEREVMWQEIRNKTNINIPELSNIKKLRWLLQYNDHPLQNYIIDELKCFLSKCINRRKIVL
jgi:hypothetical protein